MPNLPAPVWAVILLALLVVAVMVSSGAVALDQIEAVLANLAGIVVSLLVIVMGALAVPVLLIGGLYWVHDRDKALELAAAGILFAAIAGLWHFGFWSWLAAHSGERARRYSVHVNALAVVSWPAR